MTALHERQATRINPTTVRSARPVVAPLPPAMVGRVDELDRLATAVQSPPAVVLVEGEAGIGKTRLISELHTRPFLAATTFLTGTCQSIREPFPLGPVLEALRGLAGRLAGATLSPVAGALRPLLPELRDRLPEPPERLDNPVAERHRLFRGLAELLSVVCPAILVLEDLHWADAQTGDFLRYLLTDPPPRLSLVLTFRDGEVDPALRAALRKLPPAVTRCELTLTPLDADQTGQLAAAIAKVERVPEEFAEELCERTGGLPFAVEQVMALLRDRGVAPEEHRWSRGTLAELGVPAALRDHVQERAALLPVPARSMLEALAVMRYPATEQEVAAVSGHPPDKVAAGLSEGISSGLLVDTDLRVGFRHMLAAQAIYDGIPGPRRRELHNRAAAVLADSGDGPLGRIAHHLRLAGRQAEWVVVAERAADRAVELGNHDEAARLLEEILRQGAADPASTGRLAIKLGWAATEVLRVTRVADLLFQALRHNPPRSVRGELEYLLGVLSDQDGQDPERTHRLLRQAATNLGDRPELRARALVALGLRSRPDLPFSARKKWLDRALTMLPELPEPDTQVFLLGKITSGLVEMGYPQWWDLMDRLRVMVRDQPQSRYQVNAWYSVGSSACFAGHDRIAGELLNSGLRAAADGRYQRMELFLRGALAGSDYIHGNWQGLDRTLAELIDQTEAYVRCRAMLRAVAGCLALARGELEFADRELTEAVGDRVDGSSFSLAIATAGRIRLALVRHDRETARATLDAYIRGLRPGLPVWPVVYRALPWLVEAYLADGQLSQARALILRCWRELRKRAAPLAPASLRHARGLLALAAGESMSAAYHLLTAGQRYELRNCPYEAAQARELAARALLAAGRAEAVELPLREALTTYDQLDASWDLARAARLAREHGVSVPARHRGGHRGYGDELTPREREVALLAATGRTNKEIAGELFVSAETVKKHLQAVMRKLGVRSRAALARRIPV